MQRSMRLILGDFSECDAIISCNYHLLATSSLRLIGQICAHSTSVMTDDSNVDMHTSVVVEVDLPPYLCSNLVSIY